MKRIRFNDGWVFVNSSGNSFADFEGRQAQPVTLPHDCVIGTARVNDPSLGASGYYRSANVHYTKRFEIEEYSPDKAVYVEFEGAYQQAFVYVNGAYADQLAYGYGNYFIDITRFIEPGKNEIKVVLKNAGVSGRWYTGGGLYRDVNLYVGEPVHIKCEGARVSTDDAEADQAVLRVIVPIRNAGARVADVRAVCEIHDVCGNPAARAEAPVTLLPHDEKDAFARVVVECPELWDEHNPYLYRIKTTLYENGVACDSFEDSFGIRKLQLDAKKGLRVNGKRVLLRGGCVHHDSGMLGSATFENAEERRVRRLKEAGYNAIRSAHNPASKAMLRACDELGMYVMDELTDAWTSAKADFDYGMRFAQNWERDVTNMVLKDFNHPSVILYSIGNEIPEVGNKFDADWGRRITERIRALDPTRYVTNSVNLMLAVLGRMGEIAESFGIRTDGEQTDINIAMTALGDKKDLITCHPIASAATEEAFAQVDVAGYNYAEDRYESDAVQYPNRIIVGSETSAHKLAKNWALVKKLPNVLGDFVWTAWDYLGEAGIGRCTYDGDEASFTAPYPWRVGYCGTFDINGERQPSSYWREIVWGLRKEPYIAVCPPERYGETYATGIWGFSVARAHWDWRGDEGKPIEIEVYADADEVELFINGKSFGVKPVGEARPFFATFDVVYAPGEVKAVAWKGGERTEHVLRSASGRVSLCAFAEETEIRASVDVGYVNILFMDEHGVCDCGKAETVRVCVEGGELLALGSADPASEESFVSTACKTYEGRALAIVRAAQPGIMRAKVSAEGYETKTVEINVV